MSDQEINQAIAEFCGWRVVGAGRIWKKPNEAWPWRRKLPNYCTDLNAIHEAEKAIVKADLWWKYCTQLNHIVCADADEPPNQDPETLWEMIHATARQRAEAFLRTINKWRDQ